MRRSRIIAFAVVVFWCAAVVAACGLDEGGNVVLVNDYLDGSGSFDALIDGPIADGNTSDSPVVTADSGPSDSATGPDGTTVVDAGKPYLCGIMPVADCTTDCAGFPQLCGTVCISGCGLCPVGSYQCDACFSDGGYSVSVCEPQDAAAFASCLNNQSRCACNDQGNCPGANQTCNGNMCFECGEPDAGNNGSTCKSGTGGHMCKTDPGNFGKCN